jgi:hypothetical protein
MILDCSLVPDQAGAVHGLFWNFICDGCREGLFRRGKTTRGPFYGLLRQHQGG